MSRTLQEIDYGSSVFVQENGVDVEYIIISKDTVSCELLRKNAVVSRRMNPTKTAVYTDCEMDMWLCNDTTGFLSRFDAATLSAFVSRSISTFTHGDTKCHYISRKAYLLSYGQCFGGNPTALYPETTILPALMLKRGTGDANLARIANGDGSNAEMWFLRSASSATSFWYVYNSGNGGSGSPSNNLWCRPVLSVAPATAVSDAGAGAIHLLPVTTTRKVEFKALIGTSNLRPRKCLVQYAAQGLNNVSVKVCNNYSDTNPVWVDATSGGEVVLNNESKQTNQWQIGIHCYGETTTYNPAYFKEPQIIVEV